MGHSACHIRSYMSPLSTHENSSSRKRIRQNEPDWRGWRAPPVNLQANTVDRPRRSP